MIHNLTVVPQPIRITGMSIIGGNLHLTWNTISGQAYRVQFRDSLTTGNWTNLGTPVTATGPAASADDPIGTRLERHYRIAEP